MSAVQARPWRQPRHTSALLFLGCGQNFQAPRPYSVPLPSGSGPGTRGLAGPSVMGWPALCPSALWRYQDPGPVALATRAPSVPENHLAGRMAQTEARWRHQEGHCAGAWSGVWCPGLLPLPRSLQLQRVAGGPHLLHPPDGSRVWRSPAQALGSPEDLAQHLEKGPSLRAGGEGAGGWLQGCEGGRAHHPSEGSWRERELQSYWGPRGAWVGERFWREHGHASRPRKQLCPLPIPHLLLASQGVKLVRSLGSF